MADKILSCMCVATNAALHTEPPLVNQAAPCSVFFPLAMLADSLFLFLKAKTMSEATKVWVVQPEGRNYQIRWVDPDNGRVRSKAAKTTRKREAERLAGKLESDLLAGKLATTINISWEDFRQRYEEHYVSGLADRTGDTVYCVLNVVERIANPKRLSDLTAARISAFQAKLRADGMAEATIGRHSRHLKAALRWAVEVGLLRAAPKIRMPKRAKGAKAMKGRPVTTEEFERLLMVTTKVVGDDAARAGSTTLKGSGGRGCDCPNRWTCIGTDPTS